MNNFTTIEKLQMRVSASYGAVVKYGDKVFVTDCHWRDGFFAEVYEFIETPNETGLSTIECRLHLIARSNTKFKDNGHAMEWCFSKK